MEKNQKKNVEIFGDVVKIKDLLLGMCISLVSTFGAYFLAPQDPPKPLIYGMIGVLVGTILCCFIIRPKRKVKDLHSK